MKKSIIRYAGTAICSVLAPAAMAATFTVTTAVDTVGPVTAGSLREAIIRANNNIGVADVIDFQIPPVGGMVTITPVAPLPALTDQAGVLIDGFSQTGTGPGANPPTSIVVGIELDGSAVGPGAWAYQHGIHIMSSNNTIQGLCVHSFPHDGISIQGVPQEQGGANHNVIRHNLVGTDPSGTIAMPNCHGPGGLWGGIYVKVVPQSPLYSVAQHNLIRENLSSGNGVPDPDPAPPFTSVGEGIGISSCPDCGDVSQNIVIGNYVGTDITGVGPLGNFNAGVYIGEGAHHNRVGEDAAGSAIGNLIGANGYEGVSIVGYDASEPPWFTDDNIVSNNLIGVNVYLWPMGNAMHGVAIGAYGAADYGDVGRYYGGHARNNQVRGNTIAYNHRTGVMVWEWGQEQNARPDNASYNTISQNSIHDNGNVDPGYLGIDLQFDALTTNDYGPNDGDTGPNQFLNFPDDLMSAVYSAGTTTISGTISIDSDPTQAVVEVFKSVLDNTFASFHGEGAVYLGTAIPVVGGSWSLNVSGTVVPGDWITATTTDQRGNTSEFAQNVSVEGEEVELDYGDAPDPFYPTLNARNGARHVIDQRMFMGNLIDPEGDGQPDPNALGDDNNGQPDEDGVTIQALFPGAGSVIDVTVSQDGMIDAWIDFDGNGSWLDAGEQVLASVPVFSGFNSLPINVPSTAPAGLTTYARVRYSTVGGLAPTGTAMDGEVEDYEVMIEDEGLLGAIGDWVWDDLNANGIQEAGEPGLPGVVVTLYDASGTSIASTTTNASGNYLFSGLTTGTYEVGFTLLPGYSFSPPNQGADDTIDSDPDPATGLTGWITLGAGQVDLTWDAGMYREGGEDLDWGDAPDFPGAVLYPTLSSSMGANHVASPNFCLGTNIDTEPDGQPTLNADGDDVLDGNDDEDGVTWYAMVPGLPSQVDIFLTGAGGMIDAWVDFAGNSNWTDPGDQILSAQPVVAGLNSFTFNVPASAVPGTMTYTRVRLSTAGGLPTTGGAQDGEVEDDVVVIGEEQEGIDWGDAPDPTYPTLAASGGASHIIVPGVFLGNQVDGEPNGQPDPTATGDDVLDGNDDEDGVLFTSQLVINMPATMQVTASMPGFLDAWIDFNGNGTWDHPAELIYSGPVNPGMNNLNFIVPPWAVPINTFARFRYNTTAAGLSPRGQAPDGEVEDYLLTIREQEMDELDWGDAPDQPYPTYALTNGANHFIVPGMMMGNLIDGEPNGQPNPTATGDDLANIDDEDGVWWSGQPTTGQPVTVFISVTQPGFIDAWIDYNQDGIWGPLEQVLLSVPVNPGLNSFVIAIPGGALPGSTFSRFRYSSVGGLPPVGPAGDGEVEDYELRIKEGQEEDIDWGDAPDPTYPTLAASIGASHVIVNDPTGSPYCLGQLIDPEPNGQPDPTATGDDVLDGNDDEDGVTFPTAFIPNVAAVIQVTASHNGFLNVWIDLDGNGDWTAANERIFTDLPVSAGTSSIGFLFPPATFSGTTFARFRYTTQPLPAGVNYGGQAPDGEVEDYMVKIEEKVEVDWGDAPVSYPTLILNNGARHLIVPGYHMGPSIDGEPNGQPSVAADGDDTNLLFPGVPDDEDGVYFYPLVPGLMSAMDVTVTGAGRIDAWIDFNQDGTFGGAGEQIAFSTVVNPGLNQLKFPVPPGLGTGPTIARVRFSSVGGLLPTGQAPDGEVEDYEVKILPENAEVCDYGDAPDPFYPTLNLSGGAAHVIGGGPHLGLVPPDGEPDGQPDPAALGDDLNMVYPGGPDDEDGVTFPYALISGQPTIVEIVAPAGGLVDMWIDWNRNGSWADAGDKVLPSVPMTPGANYLTIFVPPMVPPMMTGPTKARVRISTAGGLPPTGFAPDGEVEDHDVFLYDESERMDFGDAPNLTISAVTNYPTTMMDFGAAHLIDSLFMGFLVDGEIDGQPSANATGDDTAGAPDEDGVSFDTVWISGCTAQITVTVNPALMGNYDLDAWVDWDGDGTWTQADNHVLISQSVSPGPNVFTIPVPSGMGPVKTFARFRLFHPGTGVGFGGFVHGGEVEDYEVPIGKGIQAQAQIDHSTVPKKLVLSWPAEPGATNYSIYSSTNLLPTFPQPPNWTLELSGIASLTWNENLTVSTKFYVVVAFP